LWQSQDRNVLNILILGVFYISEDRRQRIATKDGPRRFGKPLAYDKYGLWRYRIQDTRIICRIYDEEVLVLVVKEGQRKRVYG